jgi:hypothetical protein
VGIYVTCKGKRQGKGSAEKFLHKAALWLLEHCEYLIEEPPRLQTSEDGKDEATLYLLLHPAAEPLTLHCSQRSVELEGKTSGVGPGYHRYLHDLADELGTTLGITWTKRSRPRLPGNTARAMRAWLKTTATTLVDLLEQGQTHLALSMPIDPQFSHDLAIATPLGPRSLEWVQDAAEDPKKGLDIFPWWSDGLNAEEARGRALVLLWQEMRFRPPVDDAEQHLLRRISSLLARAYELDNDLPLPWHEWLDILEWLDVKGKLRTLVARKAKSITRPHPIGYRRQNITIRPFPSWEITIPGSFQDFFEDDDVTWYAGEQGRWVRVSAYGGDAGVAGGKADALLAVGREQARGKGKGKSKAPPPIDILEYEGAQGKGWARVHPQPEGGPIIEGHSAVDGSLAICTIGVASDALIPWALDTWRSLVPVTSG